MSEQPAEEQPAMGGGDQLAAYEFTIECDLIHRGEPCARTAVYSAKIHKCGQGRDIPGGQLVLVCGWIVKEMIGLDYPHRCPDCHHAFGSFDEMIWEIQPIGSQQ